MKPGPILVIGSPRDPTIRHTVQSVQEQRLEFQVLDLDQFCLSGIVEGKLDDPHSLRVRDGLSTMPFTRFRSLYARFIDAVVEGDEVRRWSFWSRYRSLQLAVNALDMLVVNRPYAGESNGSKPMQTSMIRHHGFRVPQSCSTNIPAAAEAFIHDCPQGAIYKSNSGERSIVHEVTAEDVRRLPTLTICPVFFQEHIRGDDIRVHVVRNECHGVLIRSTSVDYRYDVSDSISERPFEVPSDLASKCIAITAALGLEFSGIDLVRSDHDGEFYCLEVNPMPGYHGYDVTLDGSISRALGGLLAEGHPRDRPDGPAAEVWPATPSVQALAHRRDPD